MKASSKAVLSPVAGVTCRYSDIKGYTPQDAIYDWTTGRTFMCSTTQGHVDISDVERLCEMGVTKLVFTCGGSSETINLVHEDGKRNQDARYRFEPAALYATDEVIDSLTYIRKWQK